MSSPCDMSDPETGPTGANHPPNMRRTHRFTDPLHAERVADEQSRPPCLDPAVKGLWPELINKASPHRRGRATASATAPVSA
jgi:hypothetical protein